jgi:hypothetical protein
MKYDTVIEPTWGVLASLKVSILQQGKGNQSSCARESKEGKQMLH